MNINKNIKPWLFNLKAFFVLCCFIVSGIIYAQNISEKKLLASAIETIVINGNQIFTISVSTSKTDYISIKSTLDGEYQNQFQVITTENDNALYLSLEQIVLTDIADDKRNAHKVIAATLYLDIPENLKLKITSDIGSAKLNGNFESLYIELLGGYCEVQGELKRATINTIDGNISVTTQSATINAVSNHGNVTKDKFVDVDSIWDLRSINGDITVAKLE